MARLYPKVSSLGKRLPLTDPSNVVTLWYRAPELLLGEKDYSFAMDVWSLGCIFGEMLSGKPLFSGSSVLEMLELIFQLLGTPSEQTWRGLSRLNLSLAPRIQYSSSLRSTLEHVDDLLALDLLSNLLTLDPSSRPNAQQVLDHPYFKEESSPPPVFPHSFELAATLRAKNKQ